MDSRARQDVDLFDQLKTERAQLDSLYQDISLRIWPDYAVFNRSKDSVEGDKRSFELLDSTGAVALDRYASAMMKMTAPSNQTWHKLAVSDEALGARGDVKQWLEYVNNVLFRRRYAKQSNFASQYLECCKTIGAFGPMATYIDEVFPHGSGRGFTRYTPLHLATTYFTEDAFNRINGMARRIDMTAYQMAEKFGRETLPPKILEALDSPSQASKQQKWEVIHIVQPSPLVNGGVTGFTYLSRYSCREGYNVLLESGLRTLPIAASRFSTMPGEKYGRSPAMLVLPSLKMLNEMKRTYLKAAHKMVDPPLLAFDDGIISVIKTAPGRVTPGGLDDQGRPLVRPIESNARLDWAQVAMDDERRPINEVFLVTLFQILAEEPGPQQTAYEVAQRQSEKATLLAPAIERLQSEYHGPLIEREIDIATEAGEIPPMPQALMDRFDEIKVEYLGELSQAQKADEVAGILRAAEVAPAFAALDPSSVKKVRWDMAYGRLVEGLGMSQKFIRSDEEMDEARAEDEQMQAAVALAQGAPAAGAAAKDFAQAEQIRQATGAAGGALV
jgi:hypothetical protein